MATPHIRAAEGDFAPDVLLPGDPLRAERIARETLDGARLVTDVRGLLGYTGTVAGRPISVMATGMGMPSAVLVATELVRFYGVKRLVRVGTAGALQPHLALRDVVVASGAHTDSAMSDTRLPGARFSHVASFPLLQAAAAAAADIEESAGRVLVGTLFSSDAFYASRPELDAALVRHGVLGVEMETAGLYAVAAAEGVEALTVVTITDRIGHPGGLSSEERERGFGLALRVALGALDAPR